MKKSLLALAVVAISLLGTSCEKNEFISNPGTDADAPSLGRGEIGDSEGSACIQPVTCTLLIEKNAQNNNYTDYVGDISITNSNDSIYVTYNCIDGNVLKEVRVWNGAYADAPVNKPGMPEFGHFLAANNSVGNLTDYTIAMRNHIGANNTGIVVAHANTYKHNTESAWGTGQLFVTTGKAKYVTYTACGAPVQ